MLRRNNILLPKAIIIEADISKRHHIAEVLAEENFLSICCKDSLDAMNKLFSHNTIDLIILEKELPNMNGLEFLQTLKSNQKYNKIPILFIHNSNQIDDEKIRELNLTYILQKPLKKQDLKKTIQKIFSP